MLVNCHETSTGVLYDMELIKRFCETNRIFLIVDAISSFLADPYSMKDSGANITILSSQKALALPPGMSYIIADDKAQQRIQENAVQSLYFDLKNYCWMDTGSNTLHACSEYYDSITCKVKED